MACLPLGPGQLEDLLPHGKEPLALILQANACALNGLNTQLPLAPPVQELDMGSGRVRMADPHSSRKWTQGRRGEGTGRPCPLPPHHSHLPTCRALMQARMSLSVFSQRAASAPGSARMPRRREICREVGGWVSPEPCPIANASLETAPV